MSNIGGGRAIFRDAEPIANKSRTPGMKNTTDIAVLLNGYTLTGRKRREGRNSFFWGTVKALEVEKIIKM